MSNQPMLFELPTPDLSALRAGNTGVEGVWQFDSGKPGRKVLITALVHGNELCGAWALKNLLEAGVRPDCGQLTLMWCNLAAFDRFDRTNHDASRCIDEDMNRVWSLAQLTVPGSLETRRAAQLRPFVERADWLLDLHSMHEPGAPLLLTGLLPRNIALARLLGAPQHIVVDAGHRDGVRMRDFGRFADPHVSEACALLIECGFHGDLSSKTVAMDMVARFLQASGCVQMGSQPGQLSKDWLQPLPQRQQAVKVTDAVVALSPELRFAQDWQGLQTVPKAGTLLAQDGETSFVTPYDQCTLVMPSLRQLRAGVTVMRLAQQI